MINSEWILVLDCGGHAKEIVQQVRGHKVYAELLTCSTTVDAVKKRNPKGIIVAGSDVPLTDPEVLKLGIPVLQIGSGNESQTEQLQPFLFSTCALAAKWDMGTFAGQAITAIKTQIKGGQVICGLSGGVDSSVAATLVQRAVGDQLTSIFVDNGLMRKGEPEQVVNTFRQRGFKLIHVDARQRFFDKLAGVTDPEQKRKIIGREFIRVFEEEAGRLGRVDFLVQGTVYPDVIESGSGSAVKVKSHHNVGGLPDDMNLKLVEPLRYLFKDEVRLLGEELGLPEELVWRHPFPGPGLAVRIIGEVTPDKVAVLQAADAIVIEEIKSAGLYRQIWQAFAVLPDFRSVGMSNDQRTYDHTIAIRAVESTDAMVADWSRIPYNVLDKITRRITSEVPRVNRVVYDITAKPPATIEWE